MSDTIDLKIKIFYVFLLNFSFNNGIRNCVLASSMNSRSYWHSATLDPPAVKCCPSLVGKLVGVYGPNKGTAEKVSVMLHPLRNDCVPLIELVLD